MLLLRNYSLPEIVVRKIETGDNGTYLAIINTGYEDKYEKTVMLPETGDVVDAKSGKVILANASEITLDISHLSPGIYLISAADSAKIITERLVKTN